MAHPRNKFEMKKMRMLLPGLAVGGSGDGVRRVNEWVVLVQGERSNSRQ